MMGVSNVPPSTDQKLAELQAQIAALDEKVSVLQAHVVEVLKLLSDVQATTINAQSGM
jgi:prefoldin subunit 5